MEVRSRPVETWPNFFIVGAPKAGTSALYRYLDQHSQIYMSTRKEPHYFSIKTVSENDSRKPIRSKKKYLSLFNNVKKEKIVCEASTSYLSDPEAPKLIREIIPQAKILISIRDPIERAFSAYLMIRNSGLVEPTFHKQLQLELNQKMDLDKPNCHLYAGLYSENILRYLNIFGSNQIKTIIFEEWITNPQKTIEEIIEFLEIDVPSDEFKTEVPNPFSNPRGALSELLLHSNGVKKISNRLIPISSRKFFYLKVLLKKGIKPKMDQEDRDILKKIYQKDVEKLKTLLGRSLPWKNFS